MRLLKFIVQLIRVEIKRNSTRVTLVCLTKTGVTTACLRNDSDEFAVVGSKYRQD